MEEEWFLIVDPWQSYAFRLLVTFVTHNFPPLLQLAVEKASFGMGFIIVSLVVTHNAYLAPQSSKA